MNWHFLRILFLILTAIVPLQSSMVKYPFKENFEIKTGRNVWEGFPTLWVTMINPGIKTFDSLQVRIYFRAQDGFENDLGANLDLFIQYDVDTRLIDIDTSLTNLLKKAMQEQHPVKIADTYNPENQTHAYYLQIKLDGITFNKFSRIDLNLIFNRWEGTLHNDLLTEAPRHTIDNSDWSFGHHSTFGGDLIDYPGMPTVSRDSMSGTVKIPTNYYVTVYRNEELLWGIPPDWKKFYTKESFTAVDTRPQQDPMPYAPVAVPFDEFADQLHRDSANLKISRIRVNQAGYLPGEKNYFYYIGQSASSFSVINAFNGSVTAKGVLSSTGLTTQSQIKIKASNNALYVNGGDTRYKLSSATVAGTVFEGVIPELPEGRYTIATDADTSAPFFIRKDIYNMVKDALLKFYGANRCGDSKSWFHPPCHLQDPVPGGWHDCGDHLKEGATMSYTASVLGLAAAAFQNRDQDLYNADQSRTIITDGIPDMLYEAKHGADFILRSYEFAEGNVADMITSVGDFGMDHTWWGPPEFQDDMPSARGGPPRSGRKEVTTDYLGKYAANLAFVSKRIRSNDESYADRCLKAAKDIYAFTKPRVDVTNTAAYAGSTIASDDAAFACLALLWATEERQYMDELCYDTVIGRKASSGLTKMFQGGWFTYSDPVFTHTMANTDWASTQMHVLWGFFTLILQNQQLCLKLGLTESERLALIEKTVYNATANLCSLGKGTSEIQLPDNGTWIVPVVKYEKPWFTMHTQQEWVWNRYQAGNITEMFYYYDMASSIQGMNLPNTPASADWKANDFKTVLIRMMDYMLGVNPWDISMIYGIGSKNFNHPHLRAANPELRNVHFDYPYRHPVGAIQGGYMPTATIYDENVYDYMHSETGINATTNMIMPVLGLSLADRKVISRPLLKNADAGLSSVQLLPVKKGTFMIRTSKPLQNLTIYTISGRVIEQKTMTEKNVCSLSLSPKGTGMCLLKVRFSDGSTVVKKASLLTQ